MALLAHYRNRYVEDWVRKMLGYSPIVGLFGHRQVGKTSLVERLCENYYTLDDARVLEAAQANPVEYLRAITKSAKTVVIDECQLAPALFPALKDFVRVNKKPGQFLLTGSVRFSARKLIQESLTGRIVNIVVPPLGTAEVCELENPEVLPALLGKGLDACQSMALRVLQNAKLLKELNSSIEKYARLGGLPGVCFVRDGRVRAEKFDSQLETLLERDLRLIYQTTLPRASLRRVLTELAANVGQPLNVAAIQRRTRVSMVTLNKLFSAFNAMFLIEFVASAEKASQPLVYFCDAGEALHLATNRLGPEQIFAQTIYSNIVANLSNLWRTNREIIQVNCFRTRGGTNIPVVLTTSQGAFGLLPISDGMTFESILAQTRSFMESSQALGVIAVSSSSSEIVRHHEHLLQMPLSILIA